MRSIASPAAIALPISAPTEAPTTRSGLMPSSCSARTTPTCAKPRGPPAASTSASCGGAPRRLERRRIGAVDHRGVDAAAGQPSGNTARPSRSRRRSSSPRWYARRRGTLRSVTSPRGVSRRSASGGPSATKRTPGAALSCAARRLQARAGEVLQRDAAHRQLVGWMRTRRPTGSASAPRRRAAARRPRTLMRQRSRPAARARRRRPARCPMRAAPRAARRGQSQRSHPVHELRPSRQRALRAQGSSRSEPARPPRRRRLGIDRDDLEVGARERRRAMSRRLCVPISGCLPPAPGMMPSVASHQRTPSSSVRAATTRWSSATVTASPRRRCRLTAPPTHICVAVALDVHAPGAPQPRALRRDVAAAAPALPISHCARLALRLPVTGSSAMPIGAAKARTSNAHVGARAAARRPRRPSRRALQRRVSGSSASTASARSSSSAEPARAVVEPARGEHGARDAERRAHRGEQRRLDRSLASGGAANASRSPSCRIVTSPTAHCCTTRRASRHAAARQPGVAAAERRMAGERQLAARREDAHAVVGLGVGGRQQEGRLRQVGPAREGLHLRVVEAVGVVHHGERIAAAARSVKTSTCVNRRFTGASPRAAPRREPMPRSIRSGATVTNDSRSVFGRGASA